VAYSLKARIVESQRPAVTRQRPVNNNRGMVFSAQCVPRRYKQDKSVVRELLLWFIHCELLLLEVGS
jgi:hypothetical protein